MQVEFKPILSTSKDLQFSVEVSISCYDSNISIVNDVDLYLKNPAKLVPTMPNLLSLNF